MKIIDQFMGRTPSGEHDDGPSAFEPGRYPGLAKAHNEAIRPQPMGFDPPDRSDRDFAPPMRRRDRNSEAALRAAQYVSDLESEIDQARAEAGTLRSHINVLEESNDILKEEITVLRRDNERLVRESTAVQTRVETAAEILLTLRRPINTQPVEPSHVEKAEAAIREALSQEAPTPLDGPLGSEAPSEDPSLRGGA